MFLRVFVLSAALVWMATAAEAHRVALVIGQNAYRELLPLDNPVPDARRMAELLGKHGFEVIACDGKTPGCFDLDRSSLLDALKRLEERAAGADLALVFFAGHGMAAGEVNILGPVDAGVDCSTSGVTNVVPVETILAATGPARHKLVILDACRNNPLGDICPSLKGKRLSFTRIEAGALQGFLLVTSTQFGQTALDGPAGAHSPFATALFSAFEVNPGIYFEQVFNEVARATYEAAQKDGGFVQIPGKVVGGAAPADCLTGTGCVGDPRMAALAVENEHLAADAAGVRNILEQEEKTRGKPYTAEERRKRVAQLGETLARIGTSTDPLRQEARRLIDQGNVADGQARLDEALDADEKALAEISRAAADRRTQAARNARDLAVLARGTDVVKAVAYYQRATRLDPTAAETWSDYAEAAFYAGRTNEAKVAFEQAALKAQDSNDSRVRYGATLGLGNVAAAQGNLSSAHQHYGTAMAIAEPIAKADPGNAGWQRNLAVAHNFVGNVYLAQGKLAEALDEYRGYNQILERLARGDPGNVGWQHDVSVSHTKIGDVLQAQGNLPAALESFHASLSIAERLAKADPGNAEWQRDLSVSHERVGDGLRAQGDLSAALQSYKADLAIAERLAMADPGNAGWQYDLGISNERIGDVLMAQGKLDAALKHYRARNDIISRLAKADPENARWQRDLSLSHSKIGHVLEAQGILPEALAAYKADLGIAERLASADPGNSGWQFDLGISNERIGDVLMAQGSLDAAFNHYRAKHEIILRLAKTDPENAGWQRELSVSHSKIGDVQQAQGNLSEALASYKASLAIAERLARADPRNAGWQRDLGICNERIGDVLMAQGNLDAALKHYRARNDIISRLAKADPGNARWQRDLSVSHSKIGDVLRAQGNLSAALESYKADLTITERLAKADPGNAGWQRDLALSHGRVAIVLARQGERERALSAFRQGREIIIKLKAADPSNVTLPKDLAWFQGQIRTLEKR